MGKEVIGTKFFVFSIFYALVLFVAAFQLNTLGHELYHFFDHSPQSSAICFDRDLSTDVIAFTVYEGKASFKGTATDGFYKVDDAAEERLANLTGNTASILLLLSGAGLLFFLRKR